MAFPVGPLAKVDGVCMEQHDQALKTGRHPTLSIGLYSRHGTPTVTAVAAAQCDMILWTTLTLNAAAHGIADPLVALSALRRVRHTKGARVAPSRSRDMLSKGCLSHHVTQ